MPKIQPTKAKIIATKYIENGLDMSKTVKELTGNKQITQGTVYQKTQQWLKNPEVNQALINILNESGIEKKDITDLIANLIKELSNSKETAQFRGKIIESNVSNYKIRMRLLEVMLKGLLQQNKSTIHQHLHLEGKTDDEIKTLLSQQVKEMKELGII